MYVALTVCCVVLNAGVITYLLAHADFGRGKKTAFACAAIGSLAVKLILATRGHNYDMESWDIVSSLALHGRSVYANTSRFNYGPFCIFVLAGLKQLSTLLPGMGKESFHVAVAAFMGVADLAVAALLATRYRYGSGIFFLCCPVTIMLTGYHSQLESLALLAGLASWLLIRDNPGLSRTLCAAALAGASLDIKHVFFLFPIWILFWRQAGNWRKRVAYAAIAYGLFLLSFVPWMFEPFSRAGIFRNVFGYRSVFNLSLVRLIVSASPFVTPTPLHSALLTGGWMAVVVAVGIVAARGNRDLFPIYLLALFAFSPALVDQYMALPMLACAILYTRWASWAVVGTATLAFVSSPADVFGLPFNLVYYTAMVGTQICATAVLLVELGIARPWRSVSLPTGAATQYAVTLAVGSMGLVWLVWLVKMFAVIGIR